MKRSREITICEEDGPLSPFGILGNAFVDSLLIHILSFSWIQFYSLALVCKNFYRVTCKCRAFWREVALRLYDGLIPSQVLVRLDFFHGLSEEDPPWSYFWELFLKSNKRSKTWGKVSSRGNLYLSHYKETDPKCRKSLRIHFVFDKEKNQWWYSQSLSIRDVMGNHKMGARNCVTYIDHPFMRKRVSTHAHPHNFNTYVEIWDPEKQQTWHGEPGKKTGVIMVLNYKELYPNNESQGIWI